MVGKHGKNRDKTSRHDDFVAQQLNSLPYKYRSKGNGESHRQSSSAHRGSSSVRSEKHRPHHGYYTSSKDPAWEPVTDPRDVARWESQKPAVGWEYTDGTLNACNQFYTSWKYEEQAEARHAVQRQWEREHQDVEARQQEFEARKAAEEREWGRDKPSRVKCRYFKVMGESKDGGSRYAQFYGEDYGEPGESSRHYEERREREERALKREQEGRSHRHRHRHH